MLENEKKKYKVYRVDFESRIAHMVGECRLAVYQRSDRRDVDNTIGAIFLKKTYYGICDAMDIRSGDIIMHDENKLRVISAVPCGSELTLHLESVELLDTGAYEIEGEENV